LNNPTFFSTITTHTAAGIHTTTTTTQKKHTHTHKEREREREKKLLYIEKREEEKEKEQQHPLIGSSLKDLVPTFFCFVFGFWVCFCCWLQLPVPDM